MKNIEAFEKWLLDTKEYGLLAGKFHKECWEACEKFYESKKCEDCKYYIEAFVDSLQPNSYPHSCKKLMGADYLDPKTFDDFYCKYHEGK